MKAINSILSTIANKVNNSPTANALQRAIDFGCLSSRNPSKISYINNPAVFFKSPTCLAFGLFKVPQIKSLIS